MSTKKKAPARRAESKPTVDRVEGVAKKDLEAASIAASKAQLAAYDRILSEVGNVGDQVAAMRSELAGVRRPMLAIAVGVVLSVALGVAAYVRTSAIDGRVRVLEGQMQEVQHGR